MSTSDPYAESGGDWMLPPSPVGSYTPTAKATAPLATGTGFLSGLGGAASGLLSSLNPLSSIGGAVSGLAQGLGAALAEPAVTQTGTAKQSGTFSFSNPFQVGGKGSSLSASPTVSGAPAEDAGTAGPAGISGNTLLYIGGGLVLAAILVFGLRRR